ncbi:MAG: DoxX family protein [Prevotellaceae bacterium]|jgi:uncharacterized membrane protein YphA (DoxX/SURF4 family)|nr:DoxX family protein [Prevotellaceae bacterium]
MKTVRIICRVCIGLLFIFSGYVKAIDPTGSQIIFTEYFKAFHLDFFIPWGPALVAWCASTAELLIGCCALLGVRMKETAWATAIFMGFFTILTLILAVFNPVTDCGCFGEAIKLTNWQTFFKNLLILPFAAVMFWQRESYKSFASRRAEWVTAGVLALLPLILSAYCYRHLPLIDFMAYKVGANITEVKEDNRPDEFFTLLYYEKDGLEQEFTMENYPKDTAWKFVRAANKVIKKGYVSPMVDFSILNLSDRTDVTDSILQLPGYVFLLVLPHAEESSLKYAAKINALADYCAVKDSMHFFALSGSGEEAVSQFAVQTGAMYSFYTTDEKPLKSMVRANPGLVLLQDATVIAKWSAADIPSPEQLQKKIIAGGNERTIVCHKIYEQLTTEILFFILFAAMAVWGFTFRKVSGKQTANRPAADL